MAEETKRISFCFSKLKKPNNVVKKIEVAKTEIEYVDSFDGVRGKFSYKGNVRSDEPVKKELVIPLIGTKTVLEVIKSKLEQNNAEKCDSTDKIDKKETENVNDISPSVKDQKQPTDSDKELTIEVLAAKEILNDLQKNTLTEKAANTLVIKQTVKAIEEKEAPIDYENIPVSDFGLAMLRGMGWTPETGIGREQRVVPVVAPKLRPKGLGLGADKMLSKQSSQVQDLTISLKSYVKFISGPHKGNYGQVEAMDDSDSRVIVKLSSGSTVSVSEMLLVPVTKKDYDEYIKVQNSTKCENYKDLPGNEEFKLRASENKNKNNKDNCHRKEKYNREDVNEQSKRRKGRHSVSSEREYECRNKKHKRDNSRDRKNAKVKKKKKKKKERHSSEYDTDNSVDKRHGHKSSRSHKYKSGKSLY